MKLCIDCGKRLSSNKATRCNSCSRIKVWEDPNLREQVSNRLRGQIISEKTRVLRSLATKGISKPKTSNFVSRAFPLEQVMIEKSPYKRANLKIRLLKNGMLRNECYECDQKPIWRGKRLVLVLDHENGIKNDHRLKNLRMLCPNCNSQMETFCGKNVKRSKYCLVV